MATYDVIVIGAGINGIGIARDAALRGLKVLVLDKGDLCSGTSWTSTRLIHGGLRYLEYAEIHLVRESLRERELLLRLAPHLVKPLTLLLPTYSGDKRGRLLIQAGMVAYDALSYDKSLSHHQMLSSQQVLSKIPILKAEGLKGAAVYHDAQINFPERLVVENALSARKAGAVIRTYHKAEQLLIDNGIVRGVRYIDTRTGNIRDDFAPIVINVTGPWVDSILKNCLPDTQPLIGGTKGSHIVVNSIPELQGHAIYVEAETDHRPFFIIPWNSVCLIGTTDIVYEGDLDRIQPDPSEIDYLLKEANAILPRLQLTRASILYSYSGIRPLPYVPPNKKKSETTPGSITRRHIIKDHSPEIEGLYSIIGGKLTTYRSLAQQTVDKICRTLKRKSRCLTANTPLPGSTTEDVPPLLHSFAQGYDIPTEQASRLLSLYGRRAHRVMEILKKDPRLAQEVCPYSKAVAAEIKLAFDDEMATTLTDVMARRMMLSLNPDRGLPAAETVSKYAAIIQGWDDNRRRSELDAYYKWVDEHLPKPDPSTPAPSKVEA